jgi:hypothetical protein
MMAPQQVLSFNVLSSNPRQLSISVAANKAFRQPQIEGTFRP